MKKYDIIVIGGGASGLAAAIEAARTEAKKTVAVLERLDRPGKKILITGNGRCNLSNADLSGENYNIPAVEGILRRYGNAEEFFMSMGLMTRRDEAGRVYPMSNAAAAVLDALRFEAARRKIDMLCERKAERIKVVDGGFEISCGGEDFAAGQVIVAAGGCACPKCGTDGSAFTLAEQMGHSVSVPQPALTALKTEVNSVKTLKGVRAHAQVKAVYEDGSEKVSRGEVQFADGTISGICVFDLAYPLPREIKVDFLPDMELWEVESFLTQLQLMRGGCALEDMLTGVVNKRVAQCIIKRQLEISPTTPVSEVDIWQICALAGGLKNLEFKITGAAGWDSAQVTAGGVSPEELSAYMESKIHRGLYFCGECVDVHGRCGGYNLAWAWASGRCAGAAAAIAEARR